MAPLKEQVHGRDTPANRPKAWDRFDTDLAKSKGRPTVTASIRSDVLIGGNQLLINFLEAEADRIGADAMTYLDPALWQSRRAEVRRRLSRALGLHPRPPSTPLNCQLVGTVRCNGYHIEKRTFEPRPGFVVPAHVYVPDKLSGRAPAVLYSVGHWMRNGKAEALVQACCAGLARLGFVALVFDPLGQGERVASFADHGHLELTLVGLSQEGLMAWEHMRAIDYLVSRPDVDGSKIGMTGASGGGLSTVYTAAVDDRVAVAVPVCYVISLRQMLRVFHGKNWNNIGDLCNQVPNVIEYAEMAGLCGLIAPRPLLIINGTRDPQFPVVGVDEVMSRIRPLYESFSGTRLKLNLVDAGHGYDQEMREAAYGWFLKWLGGRRDDGPAAEPAPAVFPPEAPELQCLAERRLDTDAAIRRLVRNRARALGVHDPATGIAATSPSEVRRVLGISQELESVASGSAGNVVETQDRVVERHVIKSGDGMVLPASLSEPRGGASAYAVCIGDDGKSSEPSERVVQSLVRAGVGALAVDVRGTGETWASPSPVMPRATLDGTIEEIVPGPDDNLDFETWSDSLMLGRSLLGQRVLDVVASGLYLASIRPGCQVSLISLGPASSLAALCAALLHPSFNPICLDRLLVSFGSLAIDPEARFPLVAYVFGVLQSFDVADLLGLLAGHDVAVVNPVGPRGSPVTVDGASRAFALATARISVEGGRLQIVSGDVVSVCLGQVPKLTGTPAATLTS